MILFVLMVFVIYGGVHAYAFLRIRSVFALGPAASIVIALFLLLMVFAVFLIRSLESRDYELPAQVLSTIAYFWMALLFLYFCGSLLFDLAGLVTRAVCWVAQAEASPYLASPRTSLLTSLCVSLLITCYGYFEARDIRTERLVIETAKLPAGIDKLTIAQLSDVHLGLTTRCKRFAPMLKAVQDAKPDLFVVTGDLVDAQINHLPGLAEMLQEVKAQYGKFAIMGNHEYYAGPEKSVSFIKACGLTLLRDEVVAAGPITIAGVDDRTGIQLKLKKPLSDHDLLAGLARDRFVLFLKHQPHRDRSAIGMFDLQLSGHTHQGQIFPFTYLVRMSFPLIAGRYDLGGGSVLYVNRGTGTWGPPIRFLAPPEVTVVELVRKRAS